ncbi:hypothetical protein HK096_001888, partial [Nowakowskiella sp. JEL0078]
MSENTPVIPSVESASSYNTFINSHDPEQLTLNLDSPDECLNLVPNPHDDHEHGHQHYSQRGQWLRAALLGANDGLVSTSSIMLGIAGASTSSEGIILAGVAGLTAGALSMACGEYVSVAGQRDSEIADWEKEREEFMKGPEFVHRELTQLAECYIRKGLSKETALKVAHELHENCKDLDAIVKVHMRDELAIDMDDISDPVLASVTSAITFAVGAALPILAAVPFSDHHIRVIAICLMAGLALLLFGYLGSIVGGSGGWKGATRMLVGGGFAMAGTYAVGAIFGAN